jgi:hypothetical protein
MSHCGLGLCGGVGALCNCYCGRCEAACIHEKRMAPTMLPPAKHIVAPPVASGPVYAKQSANIIADFFRWAKDHDVGIVLAHEHQHCTPLSDSEIAEFIQLYIDSKGNGGTR